MSYVQAIFENEQNQALFEQHRELLTEAEFETDNFKKVMKAFVMSHPKEFIAENLKETYNNIRVFTEVATAQYMTEISKKLGDAMAEETAIQENALTDYI